MNIIQAITTRRSCRTYNGLHLEPAVLDRIESICKQLSTGTTASEPELFRHTPRPAIKLLRDFSANGMFGTYGVIKGARSFVAMASGSSDNEQVLAGYLFEKLILECTAMKLGTCWLGGTFGKSGFQAEFNRQPSGNATESDAMLTIVSPVGHPTPRTRFAERIMRRIVASDSRKPFADLFEGIAAPSAELMQRLANGNADAATSLEEKIAAVLECVRLAPSSTNSQPWRATVCRNVKGKITGIELNCAGTSKLNTYDMGIALCHMLESARALGINCTLKTNGATLMSTFLCIDHIA